MFWNNKSYSQQNFENFFRQICPCKHIKQRFDLNIIWQNWTTITNIQNFYSLITRGFEFQYWNSKSRVSLFTHIELSTFNLKTTTKFVFFKNFVRNCFLQFWYKKCHFAFLLIDFFICILFATVYIFMHAKCFFFICRQLIVWKFEKFYRLNK